MPAASPSTTVNQHYLSKVMGLAEVMDVAASEDILDLRGMKLVAKGARLTRAQQDTLGQHRLRQPLESVLVAEGAADPATIVAHATRILDTSAPLRRIIGAVRGGGPTPLALLGAMRLGQAMRMMLTLVERGGPHALDHSITVSLLSVCMAKQLNLAPDGQMIAALAGLLHDIGELYIDPAYLKPGKRLLPHEWSHLVVHPLIGQVLIGDLESYPAAVGRAVAEHHERADGTGYPRQLHGRELSAAGQAVAVAEMISGVLQKDLPLERAELALKIVPGEYAHDLLSAVSGALRSQEQGSAPAAPGPAGEGVDTLGRRIACILEAGRVLQRSKAPKSARATQLLDRTMDRVATIERAFVSTGLDFYARHSHGLPDPDRSMLFEKDVASREIQWRLRDIARDVALHCSASASDMALFASLICMLDDDTSTPVPGLQIGAQSAASA
ncbi:HD domain-containing protein [Massilia sp. PAMC28688]|uniref:HD-GYP domain-containing protein n=1 Tax=Massilia sp. PAMC28688 TaxID=2861283 RepID=UPI001C62EB9D|nr:HD domain-containing phosphohydrolase [Massilia sp. PAMC28688]QYF95156.1 HD domain-containing protein [Massilia sp. PAMC28688]